MHGSYESNSISRVQVVSTLRALLGERVIEAFTAAHVEAADRAGEGLSRVGAMLLASNQ